MANEVTYQEGQTPLDSNLRPIKVGDVPSSIEISGTGNGAKITGDLEVVGDLRASTYTSIPIPFILYSQFQDDLGTSRHYLPLKGYFEQSLVGQEPAGMIAPFDITLQKIVMRCSEDISGGTWKIGMFMIDSGTTHAHHHTTGLNWITVTGGAADTNATFDFTSGDIGLTSATFGGSNKVTAGQWIDFQISSNTDVTSSNAEFWITIFFLADLGSTI